MKIIIFFIFLLPLKNCYSQANENKIKETSIIQVLGNPQLFNGKTLMIQGFLHVKFEDNTLYIDKEHANYLMLDGIDIEYDSSFAKLTDLKKYDRQYVEIIGVFKMKNFEEISSSVGTLFFCKITKKLWKAYK